MSKLITLWKALDGYKTHIIALGSFALGIAAGVNRAKGWGIPELDMVTPDTALGLILGGLGLSSLRAGVTKSGPVPPAKGSPLTDDKPLFRQDSSRPGA